MMKPSLWITLMALACGGGAPSAPADAARSIDVRISGSGYTPPMVEAAPGEELTLVFFRADEANCGEEVVFPDTGKKVAIPVGEKVPVTVTAPASGELAFTCGMAMYQGSVLVTSR